MSTTNGNFFQNLETLAPTAAPLLREFWAHPEINSRWETAPASSAIRFHHAYPGGLADHSVDVVQRMLATLSTYHPGNQAGLDGWYLTPKAESFISKQSCVLVGLLHDVNKLGDCHGNAWYTANILKGGKVSDRIPYATNEALFIKGAGVLSDTTPPTSRAESYLMTQCWKDLPQGEISLMLVHAYAPRLYNLLTVDEKFAIRHHDGLYGSARGTLRGKETPLFILLHYADMMSSRLWEEDLRPD